MTKAQVTFFEYNGGANIATSAPAQGVSLGVVKFSLSIPGAKPVAGPAAVREFSLRVLVSQPFGSDFDTDPFEVSRVEGYDGPWAHSAFVDLCERYIRSLIGPTGRILQINNCTDITIRNFTAKSISQHDIYLPAEASGGW